LLNRNCIGVDVNEEALKRCKEKCNFNIDNAAIITITEGDARNLKSIENESIDLICTHPPYANIIKYSDDNENDISRLKLTEFLVEMEAVASECFRVLKKDKFCVFLIGDTRNKGHVVPMGFSVMKIFENTGLKLK
jgi:DNA modification methylase